MKIRTQLLIGGAAFACFVAAYCAFVIYSQSNLSKGFDHIVQSSTEASTSAAELSESATETSVSLSGRAKGFARLSTKAQQAKELSQSAKDELETYFKTAQATLADMEQHLADLSYNDAERIKAQFAELRALQQEAHEKGLVPLKHSSANINYVSKALTININSLQYIAEQITRISEQIAELKGLNSDMKNSALAFGENIGKTKSLFLLLSLPLILGVLIGAFITSRKISVPLQQAVRASSSIAEGDLSHPIRDQGKRKDEFGQLLFAMAKMQEKLREDIHSVVMDANTIHSAVKDISSGNTELLDRNQQQREDLASTAQDAHELMETVRLNTERARSANEVSEDAMRLAKEGGDVVEKTIAAMSDINAVSQKMAEIIDLIDDISFQTNLLALNAAVEAARAGDQGRGFAVVAGEVRNLAQKSADSANQIRALITDSLQKVATGETLANQSGDSLSKIVNRVEEVNTVLGEIASSSNAQLKGIERINGSVSRLETAVEDNNGLSRQTRSSSELLLQQAAESKARVEFFKLDEETA